MVKLAIQLFNSLYFRYSKLFSSCFLTHFERFNPFSSTISKCFGYNLIEVCLSSPFSSVICISVYTCIHLKGLGYNYCIYRCIQTWYLKNKLSPSSTAKSEAHYSHKTTKNKSGKKQTDSKYQARHKKNKNIQLESAKNENAVAPTIKTENVNANTFGRSNLS